MKKKKILLISGGLLTLIIIISIIFIIDKHNTNSLVVENKSEAKEQITGSNWLSMMYETGPGTGEYTESKSSLWPESGYIFNENLSDCENGGELSWNDELKTVTLHSNKSDSCYVYFDVYIIPVINSVTTSNIETDSITLTVNATNGNNPVTTYYYSNNNGSSYETSTSNTYTFSGLDMGTEYNFSVYVEDSDGYTSEVYTLSEVTNNMLLADWVINQYNEVQGNNGIYYHTSSLANSARDNSYRYAGANPNNYVCFGSDETTCPSDNLYRIIGLFGKEIKLIKSTNYGSYRWNSSSVTANNTWDNSTKPTIRTTLNSIFLETLNSKWQNKIVIHAFKVGGGSYIYLRENTPQIAYNYEVGSNSNSATDSMKIGLMYVSDYGYAASLGYWTEFLISYNDATSNNWMYLGSNEWTISRYSGNSSTAFLVSSSGVLTDYYVNYLYAIRPCFYLNSDVQYASGSGTSSDPIRIN